MQATDTSLLCAVLRERYLRDDVGCGIARCGLCASTDSQKDALPITGDTSHSRFPGGHFVLPDTNVFLHQASHHLFVALLMVSVMYHADGPYGIRVLRSANHLAPNCTGRNSSSFAPVTEQAESIDEC